jgi:signal transduction histidine kinase
MASLGQLTAGIAHEIKNPLNFVTNFAAMNLELIEELGEMLSGDDAGQDSREERGGLVDDIVENGKRILEHGRRADSIIKSMLLHARGGGGETDAVEFNAFIDEYLKLAYHGYRAQHPDFNVQMDTTFDPGVNAIELNPSDFGRVVLNVFNNAFFALDERRLTEDDDFRPTLSVTTESHEDLIRLRIRDNGPGIPEEIKSRIFEPFFTTKAAGSGTGLGLSLSYDIVVQGHGGDMYVDSSPGSYTEFVITLPDLRKETRS